MGRAPCCDKAKVKKGPWSPEEDAKLKEYIEKNGTGGNWIALPHKVDLRRCGKSCRLRWLNYLRPNIKHGEFSDDEDRIICSLFASIGSRWSIIAAQLPGRTDNDIKNYWNTKLKKKLMATTIIPPSVQYQRSAHPATLYPTTPHNSLLPEPPFSPLTSQQTPPNCYDPSSIREYSSVYEPICTNYTNPVSSTSFGPDGFSGPARENFDHGNTLVAFGGDFFGATNIADDENGKFLSRVDNNRGYHSSSSLSSSSAAVNEGHDFSDNPLDYSSIEEIKELISSNNPEGVSNISNFFVDEIIKAEEN